MENGLIDNRFRNFFADFRRTSKLVQAIVNEIDYYFRLIHKTKPLSKCFSFPFNGQHFILMRIHADNVRRLAALRKPFE